MSDNVTVLVIKWFGVRKLLQVCSGNASKTTMTMHPSIDRVEPATQTGIRLPGRQLCLVDFDHTMSDLCPYNKDLPPSGTELMRNERQRCQLKAPVIFHLQYAGTWGLQGRSSLYIQMNTQRRNCLKLISYLIRAHKLQAFIKWSSTEGKGLTVTTS